MAFPGSGVSVPTLSAFQYSFNGLTFGGYAANSAYPLISAPSGHDFPALRTGDAARPRDQGAFIGVNLLPEGTRQIDCLVQTDGTSMTHALDALGAALSPTGPNAITEYPLFFNAPGRGTVATMARPTKLTFPVDSSRVAPSHTLSVDDGWVMAAMEFASSDPRWYSTPTSATAIAAGGTTALVNAGYIEMRPVLVIAGPVTTPVIVNTSISGSPQLSFANPGGGGTVLSGDTLTIDLDLHSVQYFNHLTSITSNVQNWLVAGSTWWNLIPGSNSIHYTVGAGSGGLTVNWASAYLISA